MNHLRRLGESVLVWSCDKVSETMKLEFQKRSSMKTRAKTHSPLVQRVNDLAENTQGFVDGCRLLQSGCVVTCQLWWT